MPAFVAAVVATLVALAAVPVAAAPPNAAAGAVLTVDGTVAHPLTLDAAAFARLPRARTTATIHGATLTCDGAWLADVIAAAGAPAGEAVRGAALATAVVATAADGYRVVFGAGEIEPTLGHAKILVADRCNAAALPDGDGPWRLIASGDARGARSVKALVRLTLVAVP